MKPKNKIILSVSIMIVLATAFIIFLVYPLFLELEKYSENILLQKEKLADLDVKAGSLENFKTIKSQIEPNLKKAESLFIDKDLPLGFINFLEKTSRDYQLSLGLSSSPLNNPQNGTWPFFVFQITNSGAFSNFLKFLEKLENSNYLIEIQSLGVSRGGGEVTSNISMKVFAK
jgi:hypothetical protein